MTNVEKAKMIAELKRKIQNDEIKSSNALLTVLKKIGVKINEINWSEYRDVKSANGKYAISRKTVNGKMITIVVGEKKVRCFSKDKMFKLSLENFVLSLDSIHDLKYIK